MQMFANRVFVFSAANKQTKCAARAEDRAA